jgi:hypothetical protein
MLSWPSRATAAIRKLFEPLQDIDVYVEDSDDEAFYRTLLNSASGGSVKVARVFGLGGRTAVLAAAAAHDHKKRRALFIIDGDLPWVRGEAPKDILGLHQHEAYCVENLLVCERALTTVLSQETAASEDDAKVALSLTQWRNSLLQPLAELFAAFATVNEVAPEVPTVAQGAGALCTNRHQPRRTELDLLKVQRARDTAIRTAEVATDPILAEKRYSTFLRRILSLPDPLLAVSGKHFVIPLIDFHLQSLGCRIRRKALRMRLASTGDLGRFSGLAGSLLQAAKGLA